MVRREAITPEIVDGGLEARAPTGMASKAEAASTLKQVLQSGEDLRGLISQEQREPEADELTAARSARLMERVALVFADAESKDSVARKLERAGCPPELYYQMREMPEFKTVLTKAVTDYILLPRIGPIMTAMSNAAMLGDTRAAQRCIEFAQLIQGATVDQMADDIDRITAQDAYAREVFQTVNDVQKLISDMELRPEEEEQRRQAADAVVHVPYTAPPPAIDHSAIHGKSPE